MGRWRVEVGPYGEQERWIPQFRGEWPDVPEPPCEVCSGELVRRTTYPQAGQFAFERERMERLQAFLVRAGKDPIPLPPAKEPMAVVHYMRACYRGPHGWAQQEPAGRSGGMTQVGTLPMLAPAGRTGDWSGPHTED